MKSQPKHIRTRLWQCLLVSVVLSSCWQACHGHAVMIQPASRNWAAYLEQSFYWPHGLSAGGTRATAGDGKLSWPAMNIASSCGDPVWDSKWDTPGPVAATYVKGQIIDIDVLVAVNHLGRFDFKLCSIGAKPGDGSTCHQLSRADEKGGFWYLPFVKNWSGGNSGYDEPAYGDGSFSWYNLPSLGFEQGCRKQLNCNQFAGMVVYRTKWRLPEGVTCQHCKLQWTYMTAHSCWPPCPPANSDEPTCKNVQVYPECGKPGTAYPEHFFNCADVRIVDGLHARPPGTKETPAWEPQVSLHRGKFGTPAAYQMFGSEPLQHTVRPVQGPPANDNKTPAGVPPPHPAITPTPVGSPNAISTNIPQHGPLSPSPEPAQKPKGFIPSNNSSGQPQPQLGSPLVGTSSPPAPTTGTPISRNAQLSPPISAPPALPPNRPLIHI